MFQPLKWPLGFGVLYLQKYFGNLTNFISHAESIYLKNIGRDRGNTSTGWTKQKDTVWGFNTDQLKSCGWCNDSSTSSRICAICLQHPPMLLYSTLAKFVSSSSLLTGLPFAEMQVGRELHVKIMLLTGVDHCVLGYYAILCRIGLHDLELNRSHATAN